ncbi:hypothetical protein C8R43DRAFT_1106547 [Mycena crocata]|nr:hypothetical protein C8R43DRAFT_1106547 [Mycena crocata]
MTHVSAAEKRKKRRKQKLLEEEQLRVAEERAGQTPVSTPVPPSLSSTPISVSSAAANDAETVNVINGASRYTFPPGHPAAHYTPEVQEFIYGVSRSPSPTPAGLQCSPSHDSSWYRDDDEIHAILTLHPTSVSAPRDFSALRSTASTHPWRTIRRRNHRLLPQRNAPRPFPKSHPKRTIISAPRADVLAIHDHVPIRPPTPTPLAPVHATSLFGLKDPIPVLVLPRPQPLPYDPYYFAPRETPTPDRVLPAETFYGVVQSGLALVCAYEYPWVQVARGNIAEITWGACPPDMYDEREDVLDLLPPDQLVFLAVLLEICRLEPHFTSFVEPAVADFVNAWMARGRATSLASLGRFLEGGDCGLVIHRVFCFYSHPAASPVGSSPAPETPSGLQHMKAWSSIRGKHHREITKSNSNGQPCTPSDLAIGLSKMVGPSQEMTIYFAGPEVFPILLRFSPDGRGGNNDSVRMTCSRIERSSAGSFCMPGEGATYA